VRVPTPPGGVTFDCWSTLLADNWLATVDLRTEALSSIAASRGARLAPDEARALLDASWQEHLSAWRVGELFGPSGASRWCAERLGIAGDPTFAEELSAAIEDATTSAGVRVVDGAVEALELLRSRGVQTALICDTGFTTGRVIRTLLRNHRLHLDHHFFSDEVGKPKPDPRMFQAALDAFSIPAARAVHIGDLRRTDMVGARNVGMASIRFAGVHDDDWMHEDTSGSEADAVLRSWSGLGRLLGL
jgi:FMN phosphatase YigB (HAD superfamily)